MTEDERQRRSQVAKTSPGMRRSKRGLAHGNPELTRKILASMPSEIDKLNPWRLWGKREE